MPATHYIRTKVSKIEYQHFIGLATARGLNQSQFLRRVLAAHLPLNESVKRGRPRKGIS